MLKVNTEPGHPELARELRIRLGDMVRTDPYSRVMYSTDGSSYQVMPAAVAFPRVEEDIPRILEVARSLGIPIVARGAGTGLAGQAIGDGLVLDCFRHLNRVVEVDPESKTAVVEPGVVASRLNARAAHHGLVFGPDPSSADRATIGGMIGTNASGAHSILYGMTADHLLTCEVTLSDGSSATLGPHSASEAESVTKSKTLEGSLYRTALDLRQTLSAILPDRWPQTWRRASGYSINYLIGFSPSSPASWYAEDRAYPPVNGVNLAPLLAGSEGTLAIVRRATVRLVPRPRATILLVISFPSVEAACDAVPGVLESRPSSVELIPRELLLRASTVPAYARKLGFVAGDPAAVLVVEFAGQTSAECLAAAARLRSSGHAIEDPSSQQDLWDVRKVGLGLLMSVPGDTKPVEFIEDVSVPVPRLGEYVRRVNQILAEHGTAGEWYGHASAGCLHMRPLLNMRTPDGVARMAAIADEVAGVVLELRGSLSGEHGDGLSRTRFNEIMFGPALMRAFRRLKEAFDPTYLLNPGKVIPAVTTGSRPGLRYGPGYDTTPFPTVFSFRREGDLAHAVENCNGAAVCLKDGGVMCPSFQATREEMHSTRGRANALRAALSGKLPSDSLTSRQMYEVLDLCLECKACKAECPSAVDMARIKAEFLAGYWAVHGIPLRARFFAEIAAVSRLARLAPEVVNRVLGSRALRLVLERSLGISRRRAFPAFQLRSFRRWHRSHAPAPHTSPVVLFVDTYTDSNYPQIGIAAVKVLEAAGFRVDLAPGQVCCGRPMISKGLLRRARALAWKNLQALGPLVDSGIPIVGLEPSCILTLRDEYLEFFPQDPRANAIARNSYLIEEFLTTPDSDGQKPIERIRFDKPASVWHLHGHCYTKALVGERPTVEMLRTSGAEVVEIPSGCCGMAGSFGYEVEHENLSRQIAEMTLLPAVRAAVAAGGQVLASGVSCRTQILDGAGVRARHAIEALADAIQS